jgi:diguanylate cyclase (GGDEF)-like protein
VRVRRFAGGSVTRLATLAASAMGYSGWEIFRGSNPHPLVEQLLAFGWVAVPAALAWRVGARANPGSRDGSAWRWISGGLVLSAAGYLIEICYQLGAGRVPDLSLADGCFLACYPVFLVGLLRFSTRTQSAKEGFRLGLDVATVALCAAGVVWRFFLSPGNDGDHTSLLVVWVSNAYPTADLLVVFGLARMFLRGLLPEWRRPVRYLAIGLATTVAGDLFWAFSAIKTGSIDDSLSNIVYVLSDAFFMLAIFARGSVSALAKIPHQRVDATHTTRFHGAIWLPSLAPAVLFGLLLDSQFGGSAETRVTLSCSLAVVLVLTLTRQLSVQAELRRTLQLLTEKSADLHHQTMHDALTGLPNRALVLDRVDQALARSRRSGALICVLFLDLDGFKEVNDTYGHAAGDQLLCMVSLQLKGALRAADTIGRLGGDEFVILLEGESLDDGPEVVAERLLAALAAPRRVDGLEGVAMLARASIGIAIGIRRDAEELLHDADLAMYAAKEAGKDRYIVFQTDRETV